jgi:hypothetical protein
LSVERPIFIVGPPRSGTSLLYKTLAAHPELAWFNRNYKRLPEWPKLARFLTAVRNRPDVPQESSAFWNRFCTRDDDFMGAADATPEIRDWYQRVVEGVTAARGKRRFLAKLPSHSLRVGWLDAVFPDALFVVAVRDWRAVVSSVIAKRSADAAAGKAWIGVRFPGWQNAIHLDPAAFAARQFRIVHESIEEQVGAFPERTFRLFYEDLCTETVPTLKRLTDWCGLRWTKGFEDSLPMDLDARNEKWKSSMGAERLDGLRENEGPNLTRYERSDAELR